MVTFLLLFGSFVLLLFACLYLVYPRAGGFDDLDLIYCKNHILLKPSPQMLTQRSRPRLSSLQHVV